MKKYIALFDWDKTVRKDYACLIWLEMLVKSKVVDENLVKENNEVYQKYLNGILDHNQLTEEGMKVYGRYIQNVQKIDIIPVLQKYKREDNDKVFDIMREDIFPFLVKNNIEIIVISGAQQELIELYKEELKINEIYGVKFENKDGKYLNKYVNNGLDDNKRKIVNKIMENKENIILFSFGDSISDVPLLEVAKKSFINNTKCKFLNQSNARYYDFNKIENGKKIVEEMKKILEKEKELDKNMIKTLKFRKNLSELILKNEKNTTWRIFDDKDIKKGDIIQFLVWETEEPFVKAKIINVVEKKFKDLNEKDIEGHEKFASKEEMYETYSTYYNKTVNENTLVKIIKFELI